MTSRVDEAYVRQVRAIRSRVREFTRARFGAGEFRDADVERFVAEVVPVVLAGRKQVSALTDAWLAQTLSVTLGRAVKPRGPIDTEGLRGVAAASVYERPFKTVWNELSKGKALDAAVSAGLERATDLVLSDMQLAKTHTTQAVLSDTEGVAGFRRTLTGDENCGLCVVASTQRYHKGDLLPIHPGCDCGVEPLTDMGDRVIDRGALQEAHAAIEERFGESDAGARGVDYRKALLVREHGELGPVLTVKSHRFTDAGDI